MKTILERCKTLVENNNNEGGTLSYVRDTEVIHPDIAMTRISITSLPKIVFTPISTSESWIASQRKQQLHRLASYLILQYHQRESSIMGDSSRPAGHGKGIMDFVADFMTVFRGHRFASGGTNYLDKPMDVVSIEYFKPEMSEEPQLLVAEIVMECSRLILQDSLPGNV